ncbi:Transglutaminase-like enzyme, putative cysteine protease [Nocardioides alpinus]|uniref:Transglutaminase family protein n=1 Tax=Nocardioides alpinus TaxID=748909 RepID=A0A1I0X7G2_9ACTN|nr:transglutaminase family protein [Nocardioides alpinus]PKH44179.1 transglutaminase family protein [Nocardioides alpinus]SFA96982.1 Transglutaminase-like enzyme, putative cysteine protease [Nocardioides alpinus]
MSRQGPDDFTPRSYEVRHRTTYTYDEDVTTCYERGFLRPRETPSQRVVSNDVDISPEPLLVSEHRDHFGNESFYVEVRTPHRVLEVTKTSVVHVAWPLVDLAALDRWTVASAAEEIRRTGDPATVSTHLLPSVLVDVDDAVCAYAATHLTPTRPLGEAVVALTHAIFDDFDYRSGVTNVRTTLQDLLESRQGVCQDFTHLALGCLRAVGLPGRYVSGYLETAPPPGKVKLEGADASHAWASVLTPDGTWVDLDPTNDHLADSRYVVTAWGRDFRDVSPLKGVIFTESTTSSLKVGVDVTRLPEL